MQHDATMIVMHAMLLIVTQWDPPRSTPFALPLNAIIPATVPQTKHTQICAQLYVGCVVRSQNHYPWEGFKSFNASNFKPLSRCQVCQESSSSAPPSSSHSFCNLSSFVVFSMSPSKNALKRCFGKSARSVCHMCQVFLFVQTLKHEQ